MSLSAKQFIIGTLGFLFLLSLIFVQYTEVTRRREEAGIGEVHVVVPDSSSACVDCHVQTTPAIIDHWKGSTHATTGVGCWQAWNSFVASELFLKTTCSGPGLHGPLSPDAVSSSGAASMLPSPRRATMSIQPSFPSVDPSPLLAPSLITALPLLLASSRWWCTT